MELSLRPYQVEAVESVIGLWERDRRAVLGTAATGAGKTVILLEILTRQIAKRGGRGLVLAHRKELIDQPIERLEQFWPEWTLRAGKVMAQYDECDKDITVATVQTLRSKKRMARLLAHGPIDWLITDECFPAGTLVEGRPIESLKVGDCIWGGVVEEVMSRPCPKILVEIEAGGRKVLATANHPFWTPDGWKAAGEIRGGDHVAVDVRRVREGVRGEISGASARSSEGALQGVLQHDLLGLGAVQAVLSRDGAYEPQVCLGADEEGQSDGRSKGAAEDGPYIAEDRSSSRGAGRKWPRAYGAAEDAGKDARLADGGRDPHRLLGERGSRVSVTLQSRSGPRGPQDRRGDRREIAQFAETSGSGRQEGTVLAWARVDRVTVHERGGTGEPDSLCPDGKVYNIAVSPHHVYLANGFVVHNCHHAVAEGYKAVYGMLEEANPNLCHLGVTATPIRADGTGLVEVYEEEAFHYGIREMVRMGYLVPPRWLAIQTGVSLRDVRKVAGDYSAKSLANVYETKNCFDLVVESHKQYANGRQSLAFVPTVDGAYQLADTFAEAGITAMAADGTTHKQDRADILARFRGGHTEVLVNVGLYTEGLDVPEVSCIHMVRPTQSDGLYVQCVGRGLRIAPGKDDCLILDYCPLEARNVCMLGDVLGVPARKDVYLKPDAEPGEVQGGFTFDGEVKWLEGDANELVSRELDYLEASPWSWHRSGGWLTLGLGEGKDGYQRTLAITPPHPNGNCTLWGVAKVGRRWQAQEILTGTFEDLSEMADGIIERRGNGILVSKERAWRKQPASPAQEQFAKRLGAWEDGMRKGECARAITHALAMQAIAKACGSQDDVVAAVAA